MALGEEPVDYRLPPLAELLAESAGRAVGEPELVQVGQQPARDDPGAGDLRQGRDYLSSLRRRRQHLPGCGEERLHQSASPGATDILDEDDPIVR